jgi:hypothetical protein
LAVDGGELQLHVAAEFTPRYPFGRRDWVGPGACLDAMTERQITPACQNRSLAVRHDVSRFTGSVIIIIIIIIIIIM